MTISVSAQTSAQEMYPGCGYTLAQADEAYERGFTFKEFADLCGVTVSDVRAFCKAGIIQPQNVAVMGYQFRIQEVRSIRNLIVECEEWIALQSNDRWNALMKVQRTLDEMAAAHGLGPRWKLRKGSKPFADIPVRKLSARAKAARRAYNDLLNEQARKTAVLERVNRLR